MCLLLPRLGRGKTKAVQRLQTFPQPFSKGMAGNRRKNKARVRTLMHNTTFPLLLDFFKYTIYFFNIIITHPSSPPLVLLPSQELGLSVPLLPSSGVHLEQLRPREPPSSTRGSQG